MYILLGNTYSLRLYKFEEVSHSKCHFLHSGSCTGFPYLQMLENQRKLYETIFLASERCADTRMRLQLAGCEKMLRNIKITNFKVLLKT